MQYHLYGRQENFTNTGFKRLFTGSRNACGRALSEAARIKSSSPGSEYRNYKFCIYDDADRLVSSAN